MDLDEFIKNEFLGMESIMDLKRLCNLEKNEIDDYDECFSAGITGTLEDGTEVELVKYQYKCVLHRQVDMDGCDVYKINNGELYICFDCGTFLVDRSDLLKKYRLEDDFNDNDELILFPKAWTEDDIIDWIKKTSVSRKKYDLQKENLNLVIEKKKLEEFLNDAYDDEEYENENYM